MSVTTVETIVRLEAPKQEPLQLELRQRQKSWLEHPLVAWVIENGSICLVGYLKSLVPLPYEQVAWKLFLHHWLGNFIWTDGIVNIYGFLVRKVYRNIPYLTPGGEKKDKEMTVKSVSDSWLKVFLPAQLIGTGILTGLAMLRSPAAYAQYRDDEGISALSVLGKFLVARLSADLYFYWMHRAIHTRALYFIHKKHHEHTSTHLYSNHHFSVLDLLLEGYMPVLTGLLSLELFGIKGTRREEALVGAYIVWNEAGSHAGKNLPTMTFFPPLAPFYRLVLGNVDARNVEFHDTHHGLRKCNYGMTQWPDYVFGTRKFLEPK